MGNILQGVTSGVYCDTCCPGAWQGVRGVFSGRYRCCACCSCCNSLEGQQRKVATQCVACTVCTAILVVIIVVVAHAIKSPTPGEYIEPVYMKAWGYDSRLVVAGREKVAKVAGGHMVAGASSQKMIYRSFEEINGRNQWAGIQGVEYTMASSGKAFGIGLVQAREDQFEYGAPQDFGYTGSGFVMYVSENGAIRIEEKALVPQEGFGAAAAQSAGYSGAADTETAYNADGPLGKRPYGRLRSLHSQKQGTTVNEAPKAKTLSYEAAAAATADAAIFCNFHDEYSGYCEQCYSVPDCTQDKLTSFGQAACRATCSNFNADLIPLNLNKKVSCSRTEPCTASNFKVNQYEQSEELYINAVCPPGIRSGGQCSCFVICESFVCCLSSADSCHFGFAYPEDFFAITVDSATSKVSYWHNNRRIYTSMMIPNFPLLIDAYMMDQGDQVTDMVWKCPPKQCPEGTSSSQCDKARSKAPAGCNFINANYDTVSTIASSTPFYTPRNNGRDGTWMWVLVIVIVVLLIFCLVAYFRNNVTACFTPCCGAVHIPRDSSEVVVVVPEAGKPVPLTTLSSTQVSPRRAPIAAMFTGSQSPSGQFRPQQPNRGRSYWDLEKKLNL